MVLFCDECAHGRVDLDNDRQTGQLIGVCDECAAIYTEEELAGLAHEDEVESG